MAQDPDLKSQIVGYYRYYPNVILGKGNFATVYLGRHKIVKCDVALKIINTNDIKEDYVRRNLQREEKIMRTLHHPNIIQLYEVVKEKNLYCLSLELIRGVNLYQYMANSPHYCIPEKLARYFFYQMLSAVKYMHNLNVIHRDLKLENILVEHGHIIKIADFGLSNIYYPCLELRTHCGSVEYAAPELFKSSAYGTAVDIWSLGVVLYVMVVGKMPFKFCQKKDHALDTLMRKLFTQRISKGLMQDNWEQMEHLSRDCWHFLHGLLDPDQFRRIRIEEAINHSWITKDKYLIKRLPQRRRDLQRKFHSEVTEYLAYKLNTTKARIETHLHAYKIDIIPAMYFMVLDVLVKEVLHPLKAFENSFLYRFECWRENQKMQRFTEQNACRNKPLNTKEKKENFRDEISLASFRDVTTDHDDEYEVPSQGFNEELKDDFQPQTHSRMNTRETGLPVEYSVKKLCAKNVREQEKNVSRIPFKSYQNSRPENVRSCKNSSKEIIKNNKFANNMETNSPKQSNNLHEEERSKDCQSFFQNNPKGESENEWRATNRYREYSPRLMVTERSQTKYTAHRNTKASINETSEEVRKLSPAKIYPKVSYSANEVPSVKESNSFTQKIEILKRTKTLMDIQKVIPKGTDEINIGLQTPRRQPIYFKKIDEISKNNCSQTPSRIPVKVMRYGPPEPFSQPPMSSGRKVTKTPGLSGSKFGRGDTTETVN